MEGNEYSTINYMCMNPLNKEMSPIKERALFQSNGFAIKDNYQNIPNNIFFNNLSNYVTPKKDHHILDPETFSSPFLPQSKSNQKYLLNTYCKNSINNDISPFKPLINSSYINRKIIEKT